MECRLIIKNYNGLYTIYLIKNYNGLYTIYLIKNYNGLYTIYLIKLYKVLIGVVNKVIIVLNFDIYKELFNFISLAFKILYTFILN